MRRCKVVFAWIAIPSGLSAENNLPADIYDALAKQRGAAYEVQSAGTLTPGQPESFSATTTTIVLDDATTLQVRENTPNSTSTARFMRVQVTGAP